MLKTPVAKQSEEHQAVHSDVQRVLIRGYYPPMEDLGEKMKKFLSLLVITLFIGVLFASPTEQLDDWAAKQTEDFSAEDAVEMLNGDRDGDITFGSEYVFNSGETYYIVAVALDESKFVAAYWDYAAGYNGTAIIGTVSGNTISYGTENVFHTGSGAGDISLDNIDASSFVLCYKGLGNDGQGRIGTVSGTTISFGSAYEYETGNAANNSVAVLDATHFVVCYREWDNSSYGTAVIGTVSGTAISYGSEYIFNSAATSFTSAIRLSASKFVVAYRDEGNSNYGTAIIGSVSGTTITFGSEYVFNTAGAMYIDVSAFDTSKFVVVYQGASYYGTACIGDVTGTVITFGSEYVFKSFYCNYITVSALDATNFVVAYNYYDAAYSSKATIGTVTGSTISYGTESVYNDNIAVYNCAITLNDSKFGIIYQDSGNSESGTCIIGQTGLPAAPGTPSNPTPADLATDVALDADLSWTNGAETTTIDLYFDTVNPPTTKVIDNTLATTYDPGTMSENETYYWYVVCKNAGGDTNGSVWSYSTEDLSDFPSGEGTDVGGGTTITPTEDLDYAVDQTIPDGAFTTDYETVLTGTGTVTINIATGYANGAYYQGGIWNYQGNIGGFINFADIDFDARGDVPIILGDEDPLPVTLSGFTAAFSGGSSLLTWTTQSETNNLGWNVYRGETDIIEGVTQVNSEMITGAGTTTEQTDYTFQDQYEFLPNASYWYWLENVDNGGTTTLYGPVRVDIADDGDDELPPNLIDNYGIAQNYPNPFNPTTTIAYKLSEKDADNAKIMIYNFKGQIVRTFNNLTTDSSELGSVNWNGTDESGNSVSSGTYIYKMKTNNGEYTKKMIMLK